MRGRGLRMRLPGSAFCKQGKFFSGMPSASTQSPPFPVPCDLAEAWHIINRTPPNRTGGVRANRDNQRSHPPAPPGRGLALRVVGFILPATLSGALSRPGLVYPLASFDVSGQWPVSHADASPNEVIQFVATIHPSKTTRQGEDACIIVTNRPKDFSKEQYSFEKKDAHSWESLLSGQGRTCRGGSRSISYPEGTPLGCGVAKSPAGGNRRLKINPPIWIRREGVMVGAGESCAVP
jgi:hypothetical protein